MLLHRVSDRMHEEVLDQYQTPVASIRRTLARNHRILVENKLTVFVMGVHASLALLMQFTCSVTPEVSTCARPSSP